MSSLSRPPSTLSCAELFTTWLPAAFAQARAAGATPPDVMIAIELAGDGGGAWTLVVTGGALEVNPGADPAAVITLRQSAADLRAAIWGEGDVPPLLPAEVDLGQALAGQNSLPLGALAQARGTLVVEVPGFAGRTWSAVIAIGGATTPSATVRAELETLDALRRGELGPSQAFFTGKIAISGDVAWLMQVGMSLAAGGMGGLPN